MLRELYEKMKNGHQPTDAELMEAGVSPETVRAAKVGGIPVLVIVEALIQYGPLAISVLKHFFPHWFQGV